jgi:hypothetical protein
MISRERHTPVLAGVATTLLLGVAVAAALLSADRSVGVGRGERTANAIAPADWSAADAAAVTLLRHVAVLTADATAPALARCEHHAGKRNGVTFARCALPALARLGSSGSQNATMLLRIAGDGHPPQRCRELVRALAGSLMLEGSISRVTLRDALGGLALEEAIQASRAVRALARESRRLAHDPLAWRACRPRSEADRI